MSVEASSDWDAKFSLDDYTIQELEFWESNLTLYRQATF
jgi:hypothetical protein